MAHRYAEWLARRQGDSRRRQSNRGVVENEGALEKKGKGLLDSYKERWFVLWTDGKVGQLRYFSDKEVCAAHRRAPK